MKDNPEVLHAYVDGELSAEEAEKVKAHVLSCPLCGRELPRLQKMKEFWRNKVRIPPAPPALKSRIRLEIDKKEMRPAWVEALWANMKAPAWAALPVIILLMVIGWGYYQYQHIPQIVVQDIADRHLKCARGPIQDFYEAKELKNLETWYKENITYRISHPRFRDAKLTLMGGKRCRIAGMYMAHTVYTEGEKRISLYVLPQGTCTLRAFKKLSGSRELYHTKNGNVTVLFWRQGSLIYALAYEGELDRLKTLAENSEITL